MKWGMQENSEILYDFWYVAAPSGQLKPGAMRPLTLLGQKLLLARTNEGEIFALRDFCPHRGMPLSLGRFDGTVVECCYHGWCFDKKGACTAIPSLPEDDKTDITRIKTATFPTREHNGLIWVYIPTPKTRLPEILPPLPTLPGPIQNLDLTIRARRGAKRRGLGSRPHSREANIFYHVESVMFPCSIDHAVIGLMDPAHGPYVHASWWWRSQRSMHLKQKNFEPTPLGFKMASHKPSANSRAYRILLGGDDISTEISFQLPALRSEHITIGKHHIVLLTALTPIDENSTLLHQFMFTTLPLLNRLRALIKPFGKAFINQDLQIVKKQQQGLEGDHPSLMLLGDADQQALWYYKLKKTWNEAKQAGMPFVNPLAAKTLRWRS